MRIAQLFPSLGHCIETQALTTCKNNVLMLRWLFLKASMNEWKLIINKAFQDSCGNEGRRKKAKPLGRREAARKAQNYRSVGLSSTTGREMLAQESINWFPIFQYLQTNLCAKLLMLSLGLYWQADRYLIFLHSVTFKG